MRVVVFLGSYPFCFEVEPGFATADEFFMTLLAANFGAKLVNFCYDTAFWTKDY